MLGLPAEAGITQTALRYHYRRVSKHVFVRGENIPAKTVGPNIPSHAQVNVARDQLALDYSLELSMHAATTRDLSDRENEYPVPDLSLAFACYVSRSFTLIQEPTPAQEHNVLFRQNLKGAYNPIVYGIEHSYNFLF